MGFREDLTAAVAQVATNYGEVYVKDIKAALSKADKIASGNLYNSINYNVTYSDTGVRLEILYLSYLHWINSGRRPGTLPPVNAIEEWITIRNVPINANARRNAIGRFSKGFKIRQGRNGLGQFTSKESVIKKLAWAIAMSIKKKGIKAVPILDAVAAKNYGPMQEAANIAAVNVAQKHINDTLADLVTNSGLLIQTTY